MFWETDQQRKSHCHDDGTDAHSTKSQHVQRPSTHPLDQEQLVWEKQVFNPQPGGTTHMFYFSWWSSPLGESALKYDSWSQPEVDPTVELAALRWSSGASKRRRHANNDDGNTLAPSKRRLMIMSSLCSSTEVLDTWNVESSHQLEKNVGWLYERHMSISWRFYPKRLTFTLHSYTVDAATRSSSGLSVLLKDTSTRAGIEPPTAWLKDGPAVAQLISNRCGDFSLK